MRKRWAFTLTELAVVVASVAALAAVLLPAAISQTEAQNRRKCAANLSMIAKACITYQDGNGDYFPCHWDGRQFGGEQVTADTVAEGYNNPMQSLALLYPNYVDRPAVFGCPSTEDKPVIARTRVSGAWHLCFGDPGKLDPSLFQSMAVKGSCTTAEKCSYLYDPSCHFRAAGPGQAIAADADGYTWKTAEGKVPEHTAGWSRKPAQPNHEDGQNVMYFDGHVKWTTTVFCSDEPKDNVFAIEAGSNPDVDAALWDETYQFVGGKVLGQYPDIIKP